MLNLKHQQHLNTNKKWAEMTHLEKIAETELTYAENVKLGYWTEDRFNAELTARVNAILAN